VSWCLGVLVSWCLGVLVSWCLGVLGFSLLVAFANIVTFILGLSYDAAHDASLFGLFSLMRPFQPHPASKHIHPLSGYVNPLRRRGAIQCAPHPVTYPVSGIAKARVGVEYIPPVVVIATCSRIIGLFARTKYTFDVPIQPLMDVVHSSFGPPPRTSPKWEGAVLWCFILNINIFANKPYKYELYGC